MAKKDVLETIKTLTPILAPLTNTLVSGIVNNVNKENNAGSLEVYENGELVSQPNGPSSYSIESDDRKIVMNFYINLNFYIGDENQN